MPDVRRCTYEQFIALFSDQPLNPADDNIITGAQRGPLPKFETVLGLYHKRIYNLAFRLLGDRDEASDLTQETFVNAFKAYGRFRGTGDAVFPWLCRIAVNGCRNRFRQMGRTREYEVLSLDDTPDGDGCPGSSMDVPDSSGDPASVLQRLELDSKIQEAVQSLPPEFRLVIVLRDMQGLSYKEIAEATGVSLELVKARLFRARAGLRRKLSAYLEE